MRRLCRRSLAHRRMRLPPRSVLARRDHHQGSARRERRPPPRASRSRPRKRPRSRRASTPPRSPGTRPRTTRPPSTSGAKDEFARLGIEVVAVTDAGFDAAKQKNDVETILAKKPSDHPLAAGRSRHGGRGLPPGARGRHQARLRRQRAERLRPGQGLRHHRLRRPLPDGREGGRRHGRRDRRQGQGRLPLPRRQFLRHQPARRRLQADDRGPSTRTSRSSPSRASPTRPRPRTSSTPS